jgi:hypothetical protein
MLGVRFRITDVRGFREAESEHVGDGENRSTRHRNYLSCGIIALRGHPLPTKHTLHARRLPPASRAPELPPLDSEHAECRHFSFNSHRSQGIPDFRSRENRLKAETVARWRRKAEVT